MAQDLADGAEPVFSTELFQRIIEELEGDTGSLQACSLVSKVFVQLAQSILFRSITIKSFGSAEKTERQKVVQFFDNASYLWQYVKHVRYDLALSFKDKLDWPEFQEDGHSVTLHESFANIQSLTITHWRCQGVRTNTCTGCDLAGQLLVDFSKSQMLRCVTIEGVNRLSVPAIFYLRIPSLQLLSLRLCSFLPPASDTIDTNDLNMKELASPFKYHVVDGVIGYPIRFLQYEADDLIHLRISGHNTWITSIPASNSDSVIAFDRLRTATVTGTNIEFLAALCPAIGLDKVSVTKAFPTLTHLKIRSHAVNSSMEGLQKVLRNVQVLEKISLFLDHRVFGWNSCDLSPCLQACRTTLHEIHLSTIVNGDEHLHSTAQLLTDALTDVRGQNVIELLVIKWAILDGAYLRDKEKNPNFDTEWERFDTLLLENHAADFPSLRKVTLRLIFVIHDVLKQKGTDSWLFQNFLKGPLKRLHSNSDIQFDCQIDYTDELDESEL